MDIRLLGTGAADGIPGMFSDDEISRHARQYGGRDLRSRSCALVDGHIQIDLPPDIYMQLAREQIDARDWSALLFTHGHDDHACISEIQYALYPFVPDEYPGFAVYCSTQLADRIWDYYPSWPLEVQRMQAFESYRHADVRITPIYANHKEDEDSFNLILERDGRKLLYATDTGIYPDSTFEFLKGQGLNGLVIECTEGFHRSTYHGHLDIQDCLQVVERMRREGALASDAVVVTTHHGHEGGATHAQLEAALAPHGLVPGYDGMVLSF